MSRIGGLGVSEAGGVEQVQQRGGRVALAVRRSGIAKAVVSRHG
jgi:hypothetical protein